MSVAVSRSQPAAAVALELNLYQKRQATLLYHWTSLEYLKGLLAMIDALIQGSDATLALAAVQRRDELIANERWGVRDTSANWASWARPALEDYKQSTLKLMAWRRSEFFCGTGTMQCSRMLAEQSFMWMTPDEQQDFERQTEAVFHYGFFIDHAVGVGGRRPLKDASMHSYWQEHKHLFPRLPRFRVRTDIVARTGELPPKTGVYVPQDDPYGTLQFGWTGNYNGVTEGELDECSTYNDLGLRAVANVGREKLWDRSQAMADFVGGLFDRHELSDRGPYEPGDERHLRWAPAIFRAQCFAKRSCHWFFVERVEGEFEEEGGPAEPTLGSEQRIPLRCESNHPCPQTGYWHTPAQAGSRRRFEAGELMPELRSGWGTTIWQWDEQQ